MAVKAVQLNVPEFGGIPVRQPFFSGYRGVPDSQPFFSRYRGIQTMQPFFSEFRGIQARQLFFSGFRMLFLHIPDKGFVDDVFDIPRGIAACNLRNSFRQHFYPLSVLFAAFFHVPAGIPPSPCFRIKINKIMQCPASFYQVPFRQFSADGFVRQSEGQFLIDPAGAAIALALYRIKLVLDIALCECDDIGNLGGDVILRLFKIDSVDTAVKESADAGMVGEISGVLRLCPHPRNLLWTGHRHIHQRINAYHKRLLFHRF